MANKRTGFDIVQAGFGVVCLGLIAQVILVVFGPTFVRAQIDDRNYETPYTSVILLTIAVVLLHLLALVLTASGRKDSTRRALLGATAAAAIVGIIWMLASLLSVFLPSLGWFQ